MRIFKNIIKNPDTSKYRNLNYNIIQKKFIKYNYSACIDLLKCCGFRQSVEKDRLIFNTELQTLKLAKELLQSTFIKATEVEEKKNINVCSYILIILYTSW